MPELYCGGTSACDGTSLGSVMYVICTFPSPRCPSLRAFLTAASSLKRGGTSACDWYGGAGV